MSIKIEIEKGKSYYELIPTVGGGYILAVSNYGKVVFNSAVRSEMEAETVVSNTFPRGVL